MGFHYAPTHTGLRDRALLGVLAYTFARIGAVVNLKIEDYYPSGKRFLLRFKEKGGKEKELPVHHKLEELLDQYLKATGLEKEPQSPLFPASIGLIESPSAVITASASLPADAIASISWSRDSRSPTRSTRHSSKRPETASPNSSFRCRASNISGGRRKSSKGRNARLTDAKVRPCIEAQQWKSQPYRQARAERSAIESLVFTLKNGFEFGEMVRRTQENVLADLLEKVLAYNISQIIRVRKKLSELQDMQLAAALIKISYSSPVS